MECMTINFMGVLILYLKFMGSPNKRGMQNIKYLTSSDTCEHSTSGWELSLKMSY